MQDKDELTMKKLKTEGGDKEGIKEAEVVAIVAHHKLTDIHSLNFIGQPNH